MDYTITVLGTGSIQPYIFSSNLLRENIGASELVARVTTRLVQETLDLPEIVGAAGHNFRVEDQTLAKSYAIDKAIENGNIEAEVIYAGGGNTVLLFKEAAKAKDFVYVWSRRVLTTAPGLEVYAVHVPYEWAGSVSLAKKVSEAIEALSHWRSRLPATQATLGLSVSVACSSTGLPANQRHPSEDRQRSLANIANRQVQAKWDAAKQASHRLRGIFSAETANFEWSDDLEKIGRLPGREDSFVAVVHADGNGMGKRVMLLGDMFDELPEYPRAYIHAMRELSIDLDNTAETAMKAAVKALVATLQHSQADGRPLYYSDGQINILPFRPIVFGGDDVTWVCAGPLGLALAHRYLVELENLLLPSFPQLLRGGGIPEAKAKKIEQDFVAKLPQHNRPYACAGIALVKTHYPFAQAYHISEELSKTAKKRVHVLRPDKLASAIDWHYTTTGLTASLEDIRQREYTTLQGDKLHARPLMLDGRYTWRNWDNFVRMWSAFSRWFDQRNKMLALREAVRNGPTAVTQFAAIERVRGGLPEPSLEPPEKGLLRRNSSELYFENGWVKVPADAQESIWQNEERGAYFDAIEIEKMFEPLVAAEVQTV